MGNWDNVYYEIHEELTRLGKRQKFNSIVNKMGNEDRYKYKSVRNKWAIALQMIRNNEY